MKDRKYILEVHYLFLSVQLLQKKSQGAKYGDQNIHFFEVTPYIILTTLYRVVSQTLEVV